MSEKWKEDWPSRPMNLEHQELLENIPNSWMLRKCSCYYAEYKACNLFKTKFHDLFIYGKVQSCDHWKEDFQDCKKWVSNSDVDAAKRIIDRENIRILKRLKGHVENDVWERRTEGPPTKEEWEPPLPEALRKKVESSIIGLDYDDDDKNKNKMSYIILKTQASILNNCTIM